MKRSPDNIGGAKTLCAFCVYSVSTKAAERQPRSKFWPGRRLNTKHAMSSQTMLQRANGAQARTSPSCNNAFAKLRLLPHDKWSFDMKGQGYRTRQWQEYRAEIIELDGNKCTHCGRSSADGAVLQVHHKEYIPGRMPWDYPYEYCETVCRACHAEEHGIIIPTTGWILIGDEDLGGLCGSCEYCNTDLRYEFYIIHPKWHPLTVGTTCCDNLTGTKTATQKADYAARRKRFIESPRWRYSEITRQFYIQQKGFRVEILITQFKYRITINHRRGDVLFDTLAQAKARVYDVIESGSANKYKSTLR
jgi:hypothetical protein